jgi:hypothetical protein
MCGYVACVPDCCGSECVVTWPVCWIVVVQNVWLRGLCAGLLWFSMCGYVACVPDCCGSECVVTWPGRIVMVPSEPPQSGTQAHEIRETYLIVSFNIGLLVCIFILLLCIF